MYKYFQKVRLPLVVFITGACSLVIEVVATRILSPYFGNTIFTVSSVIGIVLAALSVGYYFGGRLADRYPAYRIFYLIISVSGLSVIILYFLTLFLLPVFGTRLPITIGPIISAVILFFVPSFFLGTLSPFAIKLQQKEFPKKGIGSITGEIYFWSTFGSIFGSLFTGFILIPRFGINQIIIAVALTLTVLGLLPLLKTGFPKKTVLVVTMLACFGFFLTKIVSVSPDEGLLYAHNGIYEKISIFDGTYAGKPARIFMQDRSLSGAMFLDSDELAIDYTKYYALYKIFKPDVKQALVIGGGAYSVPKALLKDLPGAAIDVSEIEPSLYELARKYLLVPETDHLKNFTDDGRRLLRDTRKKYDLIFSDVYYSLFSIPPHFTTREFFLLAKSKLSNNGIFIANLIGDMSRQEPSLILSEIKTFLSAFPNSYIFAVDSPGIISPQNIMLVGFNSSQKIDFKSSLITENSDPFIRSLEKKLINLDRFELSAYTTLTDNFSPVESMTADILRKSYNRQKVIDGNEMLAVIKQQLRYGPRYLSAYGHQSVQNFLISEMNALVPETKIQTWQHINSDASKQNLTNIIGRLYPEKDRRIILAAHYDSKKTADKDLVRPRQPVPGANDSASGVAVLLELARTFANSPVSPNVGVDIIFFDGEEGEENQKADYSDWKPLGSTYFAQHLNEIYKENKPFQGIVLDMVCDKDLQIYQEQSSVQNAPSQTAAFWDIGKKINSRVFINQVRYQIKDDHTPLNRAGIPSFLVIDFEYPPFHTTNDTVDKCSPQSLETIARTVLDYTYSL
jgi:spermidine synthase